MSRALTVVSGLVMDERVSFSLGEVSRACGVSAELVMEMVEEGVVEPLGREPAEWRFRGDAVTRVQTALRLSEDLRVNLAGAALALDLMDELMELRQSRTRVAYYEREA
ncbi:MerR family transcriptional regulator [Ectothiorhodospiraceae bacterium WFHF3C12]|nr:MerR family transcriptional regulator [Ectothiorhodospiraceae bacterium WFHF3C12]